MLGQQGGEDTKLPATERSQGFAVTAIPYQPLRDLSHPSVFTATPTASGMMKCPLPDMQHGTLWEVDQQLDSKSTHLYSTVEWNVWFVVQQPVPSVTLLWPPYQL